LARLAWLAYAVLIVYASLAPWSGWRDLGLSPFAYLTAPVPRHLTRFDLAINVLAYVPLGALTVWATHPRLRGAAALAVAALVGLALSATMEALQTYLPQRVASNIDLATNSFGTIIGAVLAAPSATALIDRGRLAQWRSQWFARRPAGLLVLLALWPAAQTHPGSMLFGNGQLEAITDALAATGFNLAAWAPMDAATFVLAEAVVSACGLLVVALTLATMMTPAAPRLRLVLILAAAALSAKTIAFGVRFGPDQPFAWLTPGAFGGLLIGLLALLPAVHAPPRAAAASAVLAVLVLLLAVNLVPDNPYHVSWLTTYRPGKWLYFDAVSAWLAAAWPCVLLLALPVAWRRAGPPDPNPPP